MLQIVVGLCLLLLVAFIGYRRTFIPFRLPAGVRIIYLTGTEFLLVGAILGEGVIGLLDEPTVLGLSPLLGLGLGFIGLLFGMQLEVDKIARFPRSYLGIALLQAAVTMGVVFLPFYAMLPISALPDAGPRRLAAALFLAASAACTAPATLALMSREYRLTGSRLMELLRYVSSLDSVAGIVLFGGVLCLMQAQALGGPPLPGWFFWFALSIVLGALSGLLLHMLTQLRCKDAELFLFASGGIVLCAGTALYLRLSPLFVNAIMGFVIANLPGAKNRIFNLLVKLEKPFYILFLVLAGAVWRPGTWEVALLIGLYLVLRTIGKLAGGWIAGRALRTGFEVPAELGVGLLSQGGVVVAMVMNWYLLAAPGIRAAIVAAVLFAVFVNELGSPTMAKALLRRAGDLKP